jgi:hypothetical protein
MVHTGFTSSGLCSGGSSDPFFSPLCGLCFSALSSPPPRLFLAITTVCLPACPEPRRERSERSAFLGSSLATHHSPLATIPFRITFFADPHPLTPIESYSYKKQGRGWGPRQLTPTQALSTCVTHSNTRNLNLFMRLLYDSLDTQGVGDLPLSSARFRALCVSALSFSAIRFAALLKAGSPR